MVVISLVVIGIFSLKLCHDVYTLGVLDGRIEVLNECLSRVLGERMKLRRLQGCLRNDFGMIAEWDGLRKVWTIEVNHAEDQ